MPGYNLETGEHRIQNLKVEPNRTGLGSIGGTVTGEAPKRFKVSGTYAIDVKNTGITPALFASVNISGLSLGGKELLSDASTGMPVISGGGKSSATFEFQTTTEDGAFLSDVQNACSSNTLKANTQGRVQGIVLGALVNKIGEVKIESTNCTFPQGGDNIQDPGGPGNDGSGSSGSSGGSSGSSGSDGSGGSDGNDGGEPGEGELVVQDSPQNDGNARYTVEGTYNAANVRFNWEMGDGESKRGRTVTHSYNENDRYDVSCEVIDGAFGGRLDYMETSVRVTGLPTGGRPEEEGPRSIEILQEPNDNGTARFRMGGQYNAVAKSFIWDMNQDDSDSFTEDVSGREATYTFEDNGEQIVRCRVVDNATGEILAEDGQEVSVFGLNSGSSRNVISGPSQKEAGVRDFWEYDGDRDFDKENVTISWYMGDGTIYNEQDLERVGHIYEEPGDYEIELFVERDSTRAAGQLLLYETKAVEVTPETVLPFSPPTMSRAAESKDREF